MARALAYYMCEKNLTADASFNEDPVVDSKDINKFIDANPKCEFIQVHPSMDYNDVVYGMDIKADGCLSLSFTEKRILKLCDKARGQSGKYCVILDDINRTDSGMLLGNLLYAMEYRDQDVDMPDGSKASIPDNVIMIFTENTMDAGKGLDLAVRRRMTYLRELKSSRDNLQKYYYGFISNTALKLVLDSYDRIADYIKTYVDDEIGLIPSNFIPGHGMFMVPRFGNTHYILDNIRQKIRLQVAPYLKDLYSRGMLKIDPEPFLEQILQSINVGIAGVSPISAIKKKLVRQNLDVTTFSLADSRDYYKNTIVPGGSSDSRGMMECILDAMILNGVFPYDVLLGSLLQNTNIAYVETLHAPVDKAAYIVEKYKANRFQYQTVRKKNGKTVVSGTHAYFTLDNAATGRWASQQDTEEYVASFNDGRQDVELIPLSGFRNHGFDPNSPEIAVKHNTVNILSAVHVLLKNYYELYKTNIDLIKGSDPEYEDLYQLIMLERMYLEEIKNTVRSRVRSAPKGDEAKLAFYCDKIQNLRLLWYAVGDVLEVDEKKYEELVLGKTPVSLASYEDLYNITTGFRKTISIKGVLKMVNLTDYQKIMDNIGIRQMIFQGPPGTSKTFESKRFVLSQLKPGSTANTQEDISKELDAFKLTDEDYSDPWKSGKKVTGGWDLVQFHPSYGYEDFIRGIEVKIPAGTSTPTYESVNRILGKIAEFAKAASDNAGGKNVPKFYLIIDEINRANLATVFGELIYGLEYRGSRVSTPYEVKNVATGKYTKDIIIGKNLYIIGTMNTADKSIDSIDYAIRRRFIFVDSPARRDVVLECYQNVSGNADENSIELLLFDAVQGIFDDNRFFNDEYQKNDVRIGHTYFLRSRKTGYVDSIIEHFVFQVIPILREYMKDGILEVTENLIPVEHTAAEIHNSISGEEQIVFLSENIMLYVKEFGNLNKSNRTIDNNYIGEFIDGLCKEFKY